MTCETCGNWMAPMCLRCLDEEQKTIHSQCIPHSALPGLPKHWKGPFVVQACHPKSNMSHMVLGTELYDDGDSQQDIHSWYPDHETAMHAAALLNACYGKEE